MTAASVTPQGPGDLRALRDVLGSFVTGVTVVTTMDTDGTRWGLTANSFSSVSLDPPLILWSQSLDAHSHPVFRRAHRFAINILAEDQIDLARRFAGRCPDRFEGVATVAGLGDVPLIEGTLAVLECVREAILPGGDHAVFVGRVERMASRPLRPLAFGPGGYLVTQSHDGAATARAPISDDMKGETCT